MGEFECGIHCEGAILSDLFGILLYDELFNVSVDGVFMSRFQDRPLDLGTEAFYSARASQIERRLSDLADLCADALAADVRSRVVALHGTRIVGVNWDRYEGPSGVLRSRSSGSAAEAVGDGARAENDEGEHGSSRVLWSHKDATHAARDLGAVAGAIGGRALAAALRLLCQDYDTSGLPDLLLWSWSDGPHARFVEVKSEKDKLSRRQRLWLATLRSAGVEAEVCHFRDAPAESAE